MNSDTFFTALEQTFAINELSLRLRENQKEQLFNATNIILEKNKVMNLTAICSENEFVSRHWADLLQQLVEAEEFAVRPDQLSSVVYSRADSASGCLPLR